jgi:hypothetical protein
LKEGESGELAWGGRAEGLEEDGGHRLCELRRGVVEPTELVVKCDFAECV